MSDQKHKIQHSGNGGEESREKVSGTTKIKESDLSHISLKNTDPPKVIKSKRRQENSGREAPTPGEAEVFETGRITVPKSKI